MNVNENLKCNEILKKSVSEYLKKLNGFEFDSTDEEKSKERYEAKIRAKLQSGKPLTSKEMRYLQKNNPQLYIHVVRIENKRKALENSLKHAKSKQDVARIQMQAVTSVSKKDPVREYMIAAIHETIKQFKETKYYKQLPETDEQNNENNEFVIFDKDKKDAITYEFSYNHYQIAFTDSDSNEKFIAIS